uniref:Uncharacterized protein n=1 Tax=Parascaris equorum TaxID=6256 RepID=A0A914S773_PAREQ
MCSYRNSDLADKASFRMVSGPVFIPSVFIST